MKKTLIAMSLMLASMMPAKAMAADFELEVIFDDAVYGAAIGALIGAGSMLITSKPTDHWNYITNGAGSGIIVGAVYGVATTARAFAEYEDGKLKVAAVAPTVIVRDTVSGTDLAMQMDLFRARF